MRHTLESGDGAMANALRDGYATASTDTFHSAITQPGGSFALNADGTPAAR
jgi:hypothetical protein